MNVKLLLLLLTKEAVAEEVEKQKLPIPLQGTKMKYKTDIKGNNTNC